MVCGNFSEEKGEGDYAARQTEATALRIVLMCTAHHGCSIWGVDVKTAFLNAELDSDEVVLVTPPRVFVDAGAVEK